MKLTAVRKKHEVLHGWNAVSLAPLERTRALGFNLQSQSICACALCFASEVLGLGAENHCLLVRSSSRSPSGWAVRLCPARIDICLVFDWRVVKVESNSVLRVRRSSDVVLVPTILLVVPIAKSIVRTPCAQYKKSFRILDSRAALRLNSAATPLSPKLAFTPEKKDIRMVLRTAKKQKSKL